MVFLLAFALALPWSGGSLEEERPCCQYGILDPGTRGSRPNLSCKLLNMSVLTHLGNA